MFNPQPRLPYWSRTYGGFTEAQERFYRQHLPQSGKIHVLDPMGGQGYSLASLVKDGFHVHLGDINPGPLMLAMLRSPEFQENATRLVRFVRSRVAKLRTARPCKKAESTDTWLHKRVIEQLRQYAQLIGLAAQEAPLAYNGSFWHAPMETRFATAIAVLAARMVCCFYTTHNITWLKPGGLLRHHNIAEPLIEVLDKWKQNPLPIPDASACVQPGTLDVTRMNPVAKEFGNSLKAHAVVTSPPYANRLDYTRLWAPEHEVLNAMLPDSLSAVKTGQMGTTVLRHEEDQVDQRILPSCATDALERIRTDGNYWADGYYYPFFRQYAVDLVKSLRNMSGRLRKNGLMIVFVRDTVRKDVLFPTGQMVREFLLREEGYREIDVHKEAIRAHIGLIRKDAHKSIHGTSQMEWWLAFQKGR